jgi:hypothetical protein
MTEAPVLPHASAVTHIVTHCRHYETFPTIFFSCSRWKCERIFSHTIGAFINEVLASWYNAGTGSERFETQQPEAAFQYHV